jgi:hypothetical protein
MHSLTLLAILIGKLAFVIVASYALMFLIGITIHRLSVWADTLLP